MFVYHTQSFLSLVLMAGICMDEWSYRTVFFASWMDFTGVERESTCCGTSVLLLGKEAIASPSIGNTLWRVSTMFTRPAITPPEVNGFGWNLGHLEYIIWSWSWQIFSSIRTEATVGEWGEIFFCEVNNARLYQFPVSQISRNCTQDVDLCCHESFRKTF